MRELPPLLRQVPSLLVVAALSAGIACGWLLRDWVSGGVWLVVAAVFLLSAAVAARQGKGVGRMAYRLSVCAVAAGGSALLQADYGRVLLQWPDGRQTWRAGVERVTWRDAGACRADVRMAEGRYRDAVVRLYLRGNDAAALLPGDEVRFRAVVRPPQNDGNPGEFDYRSYLLTHGVSGTAYCADTSWTKRPPAGRLALDKRLMRVRSALVARYARHFDAEELAVMAALTLGDKTLLRPTTRELFSGTGTAHILALSGLHLGILFGLLNVLFLRRSRSRAACWVVTALSLSAVWAFVLLAGSPLSLVRAACMCSLLQLCKCVRRDSNSFSHLSFAALVLLVVSPLSLFDVGFQLSFSAVFSILCYGRYVAPRLPLPAWERSPRRLRRVHERVGAHLRGRQPLRLRLLGALRYYPFAAGHRALREAVQFVAVSLSAQIGTAPLLIYYFHQFTPYAPAANFLVIPAAALLLAGALLFFCLPFAQEVVAAGLHVVLQAMVRGLEWFGGLPGASVPVYCSAPSLALCTLALCLFVAYWVARRRSLLYGFCGVMAAWTVCGVYARRAERVVPQIVVYNVPRLSQVHFISSARRSYLYSSAAPDSTAHALRFVRQNYWRVRHMSDPLRLPDHFRDAALWRKGERFLFGTRRVVVLRRALPRRTDGSPPVLSDVLVVGRGFRGEPSDVLAHYRPRQVVLDATLGWGYRQRLREACREAGIPCHDVREQGAFVCVIERD